MKTSEIILTPDQDHQLAEDGRQILDAVKDITASMIAASPDLRRPMVIACTSALWTTLGRSADVFNTTLPDLLKIRASDASKLAKLPQDEFAKLMGMTAAGLFQHTPGFMMEAQRVIGWHQDRPGSRNPTLGADQAIALLCHREDAHHPTPTSFIPVTALAGAKGQEIPEKEARRSVNKDGAPTLVLQGDFYVNRVDTPILAERLAQVAPGNTTNVFYKPGDIAIFRDSSFFHRTGIAGGDPLMDTTATPSSDQRSLSRLVLMQPERFEYDTPFDKALAALHDAAKRHISIRGTSTY